MSDLIVGGRRRAKVPSLQFTNYRRRKIREALLAYVFLLPVLLGFLLFSLGPVIAGFVLSFTNWNVFQPPQWVGLANYASLATQPLPLKVFRNTLVYTALNVPLNITLALLAALALYRPLRLVTFYRSIYFLPVVSSTVAAAMVWSWLYNTPYGLINHLLDLVGVKGPAWLGSPRWALPSVVLMSAWKGFGTNMLIFLAGLQGIHQELLEAAEIDGANAWQRFFKVVWPMLSPTTFFVLVISCIASFQVFEEMYIMTQGGPAYSTYVMALFIYNNAFRYNNMGYAAAAAYVLFALVLAVTLVQFKIQKRWTFYED